jgi:hypothetical protein
MRRVPPLAIALLFSACIGEEKTGPSSPPAKARQEPDRIVVDHILIGVRNPKLPGVTREAEEARKLAYELLERLRGGADWDALKREHSADPPPGGPYPMANRGVAAGPDETPRDQMVSAFGDVGFGLEVGGIGIADYTPASKASPYGYHIIKRVK